MFGVEEEVDIHIGTLSKAVGAHGGFVACRAALKSFLLNRGRSYIFSTSLTVPVVAAALAAIRLKRAGAALQGLCLLQDPQPLHEWQAGSGFISKV